MVCDCVWGGWGYNVVVGIHCDGVVWWDVVWGGVRHKWGCGVVGWGETCGRWGFGWWVGWNGGQGSAWCSWQWCLLSL